MGIERSEVEGRKRRRRLIGLVRRVTCLELHRCGLTWAQVGEAMDISSSLAHAYGKGSEKYGLDIQVYCLPEEEYMEIFDSLISEIRNRKDNPQISPSIKRKIRR